MVYISAKILYKNRAGSTSTYEILSTGIEGFVGSGFDEGLYRRADKKIGELCTPYVRENTQCISYEVRNEPFKPNQTMQGV